MSRGRCTRVLVLVITLGGFSSAALGEPAPAAEPAALPVSPTPGSALSPNAAAIEGPPPDSAPTLPTPDTAPASTPPTAPITTPTITSEPAAPSPAVASATATPIAVAQPSAPALPRSDHLLAGSFGFGLTSMQEPLFTMLDAFVVSAETQTEDTRQSDTGRMVPGLTARHWFGQQKSWAVELALTYYTSDIRTRAGKLSNGSIFATRLGFPIVFASTQHTAFEIIPQVSYLGAGAALAQQRLAVFEWDLALRLVAEIHFGFIGVPELSVLSGLGAMWSRQVLRLNLNR